MSDSWNEDDSRLYREIAAVAVPRRAEQLITLLTLIPAATTDACRVVEIGSGEGHLSAAVLELFPAASVLALDGAEEMRRATRERSRGAGDRIEVRDFRLDDRGWRGELGRPVAVLSSLCLHHLDGDEKRQLFHDLCPALAEGGGLLCADLVAPASAPAHRLFAASWDARARTQSRAATGSDRGFRRFEETEWNLFRHPDPLDKPSPLLDQMRWLADAGFSGVDCFWMDAGHAIYGGYRGLPLTTQDDEDRYDAARAAVGRVLPS